jgi:hypothetical protein
VRRAARSRRARRTGSQGRRAPGAGGGISLPTRWPDHARLTGCSATHPLLAALVDARRTSGDGGFVPAADLGEAPSL